MKNNVNTFEINGNTLYIMRDGWDKVETVDGKKMQILVKI